LQVWHINLERGLVNNKEVFVDFTLVVMHLFQDQKHNNYFINNIEMHSYTDGGKFNSLLFVNNSFHFEFGVLRKLNINIDFNQDGSLADITGSLLDRTNSNNITTFNLLKNSKQIHIIQDNIFTTKDYSYKKRI